MPPPAGPPGLVIAAPRSGSGKTTLTLGLIAALRRRGRIVQPYKCGPDYIDPAFHTAAAGRPAFNLDSWAMRRGRLDHLLQAGRGADIAIAEGAMGLFDGTAEGACGDGSSADIAAATGWPVVLVLDVSGQTATAAAVALGCDRFRAGVRVAGAILNRISSDRHQALVEKGFERAGIPVLGALRSRPAIALPERHLGLVQAEEDPELAARIAALADLVEREVDVAAVEAVAKPCAVAGHIEGRDGLPPPGQRIALARDAAFSFVYPHLVSGWRAAGAEIVPFSPLADEPPDPTCDVVWLPGGYPELHAGRLAAATRFKAGLAAFAASNPVHGECGGYMVLGAGLVDAAGNRHAMTGLLGLETSFAARKLHLGYRVARLFHPVPGLVGVLRGHEFHYASILAQPDPPLAEVTDASGRLVAETGARRGHVTGTFFHMIDAV
jgi:cobyrinic acid a,c-diamide synthase